MNPETTTPEISIVVTNWNGAAFVEECVASLWASAAACGKPFELIVVDDASSDGSPDMIEKKFPRVRLVRNAQNTGFAGASNGGANAARGRVILMMNNDMRVPEPFVGHVVAPFFEQRAPGETLFCVGAKTVDWHDGTPNHLCMRAAWRRGGLGQDWSDPKARVATTYAQGGSAAFDRALYLRLGGMDPLFHPTYWDDYDLCYRAVKLGWTVLYEPLAVADHLGKATIKRQANWNRIQRVLERNRVWFNWLNLDDAALLARHVMAIPWIYGRDLATGQGINGIVGFAWALKGLPRVLRTRRRRRRADPPRRLTDRQVLDAVRALAR